MIVVVVVVVGGGGGGGWDFLRKNIPFGEEA